MRPPPKWKIIYKDKDFWISIKGEFDEKKFLESMRVATQKLIGTPNPSIFHKITIPIGEDDETD